MAEIITATVIALMFAILGLNERYFYLHAQQHSATVISLYTIKRESSNKIAADREIPKARVLLEPNFTDGREAKLGLPQDVWDNLKSGDSIQVWAYAYRPKWIFWSPMVRYKRHKLT